MIVSLQQGCWPAIDCAPANLPSTSHPTLTEVVTLAIYGAPLKPGNAHGSFIATACEWHRAQRAIWRDFNGPGWLVYGLERIQRGEGPPFPANTDDDSEKHSNGFFGAASRWLHEGRKIVRDGIPATAGEVARSLAAMSDADAIDAALAEASRIKAADEAIEERAGLVYVQLSEQIIEGRLSLEGIASRYDGRDDDNEDVWLPFNPSKSPHRLIPDGWFRLPLVHDVRNNQLEIHPGTQQDAFDSVFNRSRRQNEDQLHRWSHVCMSRKLAEDFLHSLNDDKAAASSYKASQSLEPSFNASRKRPKPAGAISLGCL